MSVTHPISDVQGNRNLLVDDVYVSPALLMGVVAGECTIPRQELLGG